MSSVLAVVSAKGHSQLRRSTEESDEATEKLLGEDIVIPMIRMKGFYEMRTKKNIQRSQEG